MKKGTMVTPNEEYILVRPLLREIFSLTPKLLLQNVERKLIPSCIRRYDYGPPYRNDCLLQEVFLAEIHHHLRYKRCLPLDSIHDCLLNKVNPNIYAKLDDDLLRHRAIHIASELGNIKLAKMLLKAGAKVNQQNGLGQTPLMIAVHGKENQHIKVLKIFLFKSKCETDIKDRAGNTALEYSIRASNFNAVSLILHAISKNEKSMPEAISAAKELIRTDGVYFQQLDPYHKTQACRISLLLKKYEHGS